MSAWYILSSLGFYPVNPAGNEYILGAPQLKRATLNLADGKEFTVEARNISAENIFTEKAFLNGKPVEKPFITYQQIMSGGTLVFDMVLSHAAGINQRIKTSVNEQ
jgi:putative alpha-1,2-mannosidase